MKKQIISLLIIIFSLISFYSHSSEQNWKPAQDGDKIILIRHAKAPGGGDPEGFKIKDCKTQRNLDEVGINQSKKIGKLFKEKKIKIDQVLSSQWCRCKDTAKYAFGIFKEFSASNDIRTPEPGSRPPGSGKADKKNLKLLFHKHLFIKKLKRLNKI